MKRTAAEREPPSGAGLSTARSFERDAGGSSPGPDRPADTSGPTEPGTRAPGHHRYAHLGVGAGAAAPVQAATAVIQRNDKDLGKEITAYNKGKKSQEKIRKSEESSYKKLRKQGFGTPSGVTAKYTAGEGSMQMPKVGADFIAQDDSRLWMVEGKGSSAWMSKKNRTAKTGAHSPLKQLKHSVKSKQAAVIGQLEAKFGAWTDKLVLAVTNLTETDALLAIAVRDDGEDKTIVDQYATTVADVLSFLKEKNEDELEKRFRKHEGDTSEDAFALMSLADIYSKEHSHILEDEELWDEAPEHAYESYQRVLSMLEKAEALAFDPNSPGEAGGDRTDDDREIDLLELLYSEERQDTAHGDGVALTELEEEDGDEVRVYLVPVWRDVPKFS